MRQPPSSYASLGVAPVLSVVGVMLLEIWAGTIEMIRFANMHMSYRVDRLPWNRHPIAVFVAGVLVFLATAAGRGHSRGVGSASLEPPPRGGLHSQFPRARP
jgi:hypothetical protein